MDENINTKEIMKTLEQISRLIVSTRPTEVLVKILKELEKINKRLDNLNLK